MLPTLNRALFHPFATLRPFWFYTAARQVTSQARTLPPLTFPGALLVPSKAAWLVSPPPGGTA